MKTCVFFGHSKILSKQLVRERLYIEIEKAINEGFTSFLIGRRGMFDNLAYTTCLELRKKYKHIKITIAFDSPSAFNRKNGISVADLYGNVETLLYPTEAEHFKNKIIACNKRMVDDSELIICYIDQTRTRSGAKKAVAYAKQNEKQIINIYKESDNPFLGKTKEEIASLLKTLKNNGF